MLSRRAFSCVRLLRADNLIDNIDYFVFFFFSSRRRHTRLVRDWSSDVCSSDLDVDIVLDGTDNFESRFEINKACVECHKPLISAAVIRFEGQISVFKGYEVDQPCYQCLYSEDGNGRESCVENGVLAPVAGLVGTIQALQAIKVLLGLGEQLCGELLLIDGLDLSFRKVKIVKDSECPICSLN